MVLTPEDFIFFAIFYGLGAIGFLAITAFPVRLFLLLRRHAWALYSSLVRRVAFLLLAGVGVAALGLAGSSLFHVVKCLLGYHCSANRAGGWIWLATVGFLYLAFELAALAIGKLALKLPASEPGISSKPT